MHRNSNKRNLLYPLLFSFCLKNMQPTELARGTGPRQPVDTQHEAGMATSTQTQML